MCGFAGYFDTDNVTYDRGSVIEKMGELIAHRGPDSDGKFVDEQVALGFRRLSIIDLAGGDQPISTADGRYVIVFNGEIYNYREIREELSREHGVTFRTNSDTEAILQTYAIYGNETASRLRGMFAFVIYDSERHTLYGARDYFGIKPFYYGKFDGALLFGSEIKSFLAHPKFKKEINPDALKMYLEFQYSPLKETIFCGVNKLTPGCYFTYEDGVFKETSFFTPEYAPVKRSFDDAVELIKETVASSVKYHEIADVEVGAFLSGGVDSSYIVSESRPMKTYSVGFKIEGFDETTYAKNLCEILKINNKIKEITPDEFFEALPSVQYHSDEPHANLSAVPLFFLSELAAKDVKVVLSGEGADEFFGGYDWYVQSGASKAYKKLPLGVRKFFAATLGKIPQRHVKRFFTSNATRVEDTYIGQAFIMNDKEANSILAEKYKSARSFKDVTRPYYDKVKGCDDLTKKLWLDMNLWLPGDILLKADKMTMAHSLELRVPYLDREVWNVARTLTSDQKMKGRHTKRAFREAALSRVPEGWAHRKKAGFMVPFRVWIREEKYAGLVREAFNRDYVSEFFNKDALLRMLEEHVSGKKNNARAIYTVYSFLLWYEQYFVLR
ncbi:MAG: asparagine synthase (glutamine-hydrolyzing) [Clostridia bacterium]|nr:asparagine synthase (glutamine-hydrolyzing) [Clostridia bacterium]